MNVVIGDRIQLGNKEQMAHSFVPREFAYQFATIIGVYETYVECRVDDFDVCPWCIRSGDFTVINYITMPNKEDLLKFLGE